MAQVTHLLDKKTGNYVQIVSAAELRRVLDQDGSDHRRPENFGPDDEWDVGEHCDDQGDARGG